MEATASANKRLNQELEDVKGQVDVLRQHADSTPETPVKQVNTAEPQRTAETLTAGMNMALVAHETAMQEQLKELTRMQTEEKEQDALRDRIRAMEAKEYEYQYDKSKLENNIKRMESDFARLSEELERSRSQYRALQNSYDTLQASSSQMHEEEMVVREKSYNTEIAALRSRTSELDAAMELLRCVTFDVYCSLYSKAKDDSEWSLKQLKTEHDNSILYHERREIEHTKELEVQQVCVLECSRISIMIRPSISS